MTHAQIEQQTKELIDNLKATCASYGLGNDGNEYKIITQIFLYKFLNDKFGYEVKRVSKKKYSDRLSKAEKWDAEIQKFTDEEYNDLLTYLPAHTPLLKKEHLVSQVWNQQGKGDFSTFFDATMVAIGNENADIFSVKTSKGSSDRLFEAITIYVTDVDQRDAFARALISRLVEFNFEPVFAQKYDFFSTIFEYLIKDYNKDGGGKYAEYYTPHAVATIMAQLLVKEGETVQNVTCYDPSAGSGTLLMAIAHAIGEDRCTIYSQDLNQKSSKMLRLNLILNNLVHSIPNVIQGDTLTTPFHKDSRGNLKKFDYIVSNPPFKLDFSDTRDSLEGDARFFAGVPSVPPKKKDRMSIYLCFIQHIMYSLSNKGKAAIVVPTGFLTATGGIELKIREEIIKKKILRGVVSMPSNIFATTGTNVSIIFLDRQNAGNKTILIDASKLGVRVKDDGNQKTKLSDEDIKLIVTSFHETTSKDNFSVVVTYDDIEKMNHSFSAGQYFDVKIKYTDIKADEFAGKMKMHIKTIDSLFADSYQLEKELKKQLEGLRYD